MLCGCFVYCKLVYISLAPISVHIERSFYTVQESCTMLSVTLVVVGEVKKEFRVGVYAVGHYIPSARGTGQIFITTCHSLKQ